MQKLIKRVTATEEKKTVFLYGIAMIIISLIVIASAVVLNANALLAVNEDVDAAKNLDPSKLNIVDLSGNEIPVNEYTQSVFAAQSVQKMSVAEVTVIADGKNEKVSILNGTVSDALEKANITLYEEDSVSPDASSLLNNNDIITVTRAFDVMVKADGKSYKLRMSEGTVADAIKKSSVMVGKDDIVSKNPDTPIKADTVIKVSRVTYKTVNTTEKIAYTTITSKSSSMNEGVQKVTRKGTNGSKKCSYKIKYIDGKESSKELISSVVTKKAVPCKVTVGTKKVKGSKNAPAQISWIQPPASMLFKGGIPASYKKVLTGSATAYGPQDGTTTATGKKAQPGYVAVNPNVIPYGTKLYIVSADGKYNYGYAIAADTGGACRSGRILVDLFFSSSQQCINFGRRSVNIYILK